MIKNPPAVSSPKITLRARYLPILLSLLILAALLLPDRAWSVLLVGIGGLFLLAYGWTRWLITNLQAERRLRFHWVAVGDRLEEQFTITNHSPLPALWVEVRDESNVPGYQTAVVRSVGGQNSDIWRQGAICERRGLYQLGPWSITCGDPFGIFTAARSYHAVSEIIIHPPVHGRLPIPLPAGASSGRSRSHERIWQATANAAAVREHRPFDPFRWIHWPTTARRDELFVRQFEQDASGDIWLALDLEAGIQTGSGMAGSEEHAVLLAASLAARALHQNRAVGLAAYGRSPQIIPPGRGQGQQWKILRALALIRADGGTDLRTSLRDLGRIGRRGATAVLITPTPRADWLPDLVALARRGLPASVILLDRSSFGAANSNQPLVDLLRRQGIHTTLVHSGDLGHPLDEPVRRGFWEFRVTATGKVITLSQPEPAEEV